MRHLAAASLALMFTLVPPLAAADIPHVINFQGRLSDLPGGEPVSDTLSMTFRIFDDFAAGTSWWTETQSVILEKGSFDVLLGAVEPIPDSVFRDSLRWLELEVDGDILGSRTQLVTVPFAYRAGLSRQACNADSLGGIAASDYSVDGHEHPSGPHTHVPANIVPQGAGSGLDADLLDSLEASDFALVAHLHVIGSLEIQDSSIAFIDIGQNGADSGQVIKWDGSAWAAADDRVNPDDDNWVLHDSVLYTGGNWGIVRGGASNNVYGPDQHTNVNLGASGEASGRYATVAGGFENRVTAPSATVAGGQNNTVWGPYGFIGGGTNNFASCMYGTIGGGSGNAVFSTFDAAGAPYFDADPGNPQATYHSTVAGGTGNTAYNGSFIGGGSGNLTTSHYSAIAGGTGNRTYAAGLASIGGGRNNVIDGEGYYGTIAGGDSNQVAATGGSIAGGSSNTIAPAAHHATIGGGSDNTVSGWCATVPGGHLNTAAGRFSFAAGHRAGANHAGTFVWADSSDADFASTGDDQFLIRAAGGVGVNETTPQSELDVNGFITTKDDVPFSIKQYEPSTDSTGWAVFPHGISNLHSRILILQVWTPCAQPDCSASVSASAYSVEGDDIRVNAGIPGQQIRVTIMYTS